jgi:hypothetical protein
MSQYAVVAQSAHHDVSVGTGPFKSADRAAWTARRLARKGWNAEVVELIPEADVPHVYPDTEEEQ